MKLATLRVPGPAGAATGAAPVTRAVRLDEQAGVLVDLDAPDLGAFLARPDWHRRAQAATADAGGRTYPVADAEFAPLVPQPSKGSSPRPGSAATTAAARRCGPDPTARSRWSTPGTAPPGRPRASSCGCATPAGGRSTACC